MAGPNVLAVLVVHGADPLVAQTLRSLGEQTSRSLEVVCVSVGGANVPRVGPGADRIRAVVEVPEGTGYPEAVHRGLNEAGTDEATFLLLLHDDVILDADVVERLVACATSEDAAAVGSKLVDLSDPLSLREVGGSLDRFAVRRSALDAHEVDHGQRDDITDVLFCSDACLLVRADAFYDLGGLDRGGWPLYADVDLCWRLRTRGERVLVEPSARVHHEGALSGGRRKVEGLDLRRAAERGRLRFMLRHYAPLGLVVLLPQVFVMALFRLAGAAIRREFWTVRAIVGAWSGVARELPAIAAYRRAAPPPQVDDRELLRLAQRSSVLELRGERAESFSRMYARFGRLGDRLRAAGREPVTWVGIVSAAAIVLILRDVLFGGTFALGELRPMSTLGDALSNLFARVRREGLDPFAPAAPGIVVIGFLRTIMLRAAFAQKVVLLLPLLVAGAAGVRLARVLRIPGRGPSWLGILAAANPVTFLLLRDGELGASVLWAASILLVAALIVPVPLGSNAGPVVRFHARWALGFSVVVWLHPPGMLWLLALGLGVTVARRTDGATRLRLHGLGAGAVGAFVLSLPWSIEWLTSRSPLVGRPDWLVLESSGGLDGLTLGAGWPLIVWVVVAVVGVYVVGMTRMNLSMVVLGAGAYVLGVLAGMPGSTMLVGVGTTALLMLAVVARRIGDELPAYELGIRHALVIGGVASLSLSWVGAAVLGVADGARTATLPAPARSTQVARVLWLDDANGGLRSWSTLSFARSLQAFPPASGPSELMAAEAIDAARDGRTHRLGSVLALADVSHVVALGPVANRGLEVQADLAPLETHGEAVIYRNDSWSGPALLLAETPADPLTPRGLAGVARTPRAVDVGSWPFGSLVAEVPEDASGVLYVHGGHRAGWNVPGGGTLAASGFTVDAEDLAGRDVELGPPGWWRWLLAVEALLVFATLSAWAVAAYLTKPSEVVHVEEPVDLAPVGLRALIGAMPLLLLAGGAVAGWTAFAVAGGTGFLSSAWFCPPVGEGFSQRIAIVNPSGSDVEFLVRPSLEATPRSDGVLAGRSRETVRVEPTDGAIVESFGRRLAVAAEVSREGDFDSSLCTPHARVNHLFPEGGRAATRAQPRLFERYVIYNPFADLARASVRFVAPDEVIAPPELQDVRVEGGSFVIVDPEEQFEPMLDLSTVVKVWQGRAVVARRLRTEEQTSWSLGSVPIEGGVLPRAVTQDAVTAIIAVNESDEVAEVTVFGTGEQGSLPEEVFMVPAVGRTSFEVNILAPDAGALVVRLTPDRPIAMESLVAPEGRETVSLLPPLTPSTRWVLPMAEGRELVVVNPNPRDVRVTMSRLGPGGELEPVTIGANSTQTIELPGDQAFGLLVEAAGGAVTTAVVGERGSLPGIPLS